MKKEILASVILLFLVANVSALTASLGNSRMILRIGIGESIERSLLIRNVNEVPTTITLTVSGDLAENLKFTEESFRLEPGEEKKAYFIIKSEEKGRTETKINVAFKPDQGNGIGVVASVTVIASDEYKGNGFIADEGEDKLSPVVMLTITTFVLLALAVVMIFYYKKYNSKKGSGRVRE